MKHVLPTLGILCLLSTAPAFGQSRAKVKAPKPSATVTFRFDSTSELPHVKRPTTLGLRGSVPPLSWDHTYTLTDRNDDGRYEATLTFAPTPPDQPLQYKYVHDSTVWETTANRVLPLTAGTTTLPVQTWNDGPPEPAQAAAAALYQQIAALDQAMFDAYNARDLDKLMSFFAEDLEFYHDLTGLTNKPQNRAALQETLARPNAPHRELVPGSLEVYPIKEYGAMEVGAHRFCHVENGRDDCGTFKFVMIWQLREGAWKITRVASYGH